MSNELQTYEQHYNRSTIPYQAARQGFTSLEAQMAEQEVSFTTSLADLTRSFILRDPEAVKAFLRENRALVSILLESLEYTTESFGEDVSLALEVMSEEGPPTAVYALALWPADPLGARIALRKFDELWWLGSARRAGGRIVFDYELIR